MDDNLSLSRLFYGFFFNKGFFTVTSLLAYTFNARFITVVDGSFFCDIFTKSELAHKFCQRIGEET